MCIRDRRNLEASNAYFAKFVEEVHAHGMKIILDGVFNHCGSFHKWLDREKLYEQQGGYAPGAYVSGESPYRDFFAFQNQEAWPDNGSYEGWWGFETLPKLNYEGSQELWNYVLDIGKMCIRDRFHTQWKGIVEDAKGINGKGLWVLFGEVFSLMELQTGIVIKKNRHFLMVQCQMKELQLKL